MPNYIKHKVREKAVLTTSYVNGRIIKSAAEDNQLVIYTDLTIGSLTSAELIAYASDRLLYTVAYDGQTANFSVGQIITGGTNGGKFKIIKDTDAGATGTLICEPINGIGLADNEAITSSTGAAVVNGAVSLTDETKVNALSWYEITDNTYSWSSDNAERIVLPIMDPYVMISVKGTGTVTSSLMEVRASTGISAGGGGGSASGDTSVKITDGTNTAAILARTTGSERPAVTDDAQVVYDVGGGANSSLPVTHTNPQDFIATYTSNVTITISGCPFTVDDANCRIAYIFYKPTAGTWQPPIINGSAGASITASANVITVAGAGTPFAASDKYIIGVSYQNKGFVSSTNSVRQGEIDPIDEHYLEPEHIDTTNVAAATSYYPSSDGMSMGASNNLTIQGVTSGGVTTTVEVTLDDAASPDWVNITASGYELITNASGYASFVDATFLLDYEGLRVRKVRIKSVTSDATNGVQYHYKITSL